MKKIFASLLLFVFIFGSLNFSAEKFTFAREVLKEENNDSTPADGKGQVKSDTKSDQEKSIQEQIKEAIKARLAVVKKEAGDRKKLYDFVLYQAMNELFFNFGIWIEQAKNPNGTPAFRRGTNREIPLFAIYSRRGDGKDKKGVFSLTEVFEDKRADYLFDKARQIKAIKKPKDKYSKKQLKAFRKFSAQNLVDLELRFFKTDTVVFTVF